MEANDIRTERLANQALPSNSLFFQQRTAIGQDSGSTQTPASSGVASVTGTSNQVTASPTTGSVILTTPQNIHTAANPTFAGVISSTAGRFANKVITPTQITVDQNNYNPGAGGFFRLSTDAARNITGILAGADGDTIRIVNVGGFNVVLQNQNAGSSAANRIITSTGADITLTPDQTAELSYDSVSTKWRQTPTSGVSSVTGTANQITASPTTGNVTLSTPQNIHTGATPQFANLKITNGGRIYPSANGTAAINISKADGTTDIFTVDTTNTTVGIGTTGPSTRLHVAATDITNAIIRVDSSAVIASNPQAKVEFMLSGLTSTPKFEFQHLTTDGTTSTERLRLNFVGPSTVVDIIAITPAGNVGIGTTGPTAILHLKAGTATANTAPLKLTAGTNLTVVENGAIEFDGTNVYITIGGVRKTFTVT